MEDVRATRGTAEVQEEPFAVGFKKDLVATDFCPAAEDADGEIFAAEGLHQGAGLPRLPEKNAIPQAF